MVGWGVGSGVDVMLISLGIVSTISFNIAALPVDISAVAIREGAGLAVAPSISVCSAAGSAARSAARSAAHRAARSAARLSAVAFSAPSPGLSGRLVDTVLLGTL